MPDAVLACTSEARHDGACCEVYRRPGRQRTNCSAPLVARDKIMYRVVPDKSLRQNFPRSCFLHEAHIAHPRDSPRGQQKSRRVASSSLVARQNIDRRMIADNFLRQLVERKSILREARRCAARHASQRFRRHRATLAVKRRRTSSMASSFFRSRRFAALRRANAPFSLKMMTVQLDRLRTTRTFVAGSERRGAIVCVASWPSLLHSARPQPALGDSAPAGASVALQATGASTGALLPSLGAPVACIVLPGKGVPRRCRCRSE